MLLTSSDGPRRKRSDIYQIQVRQAPYSYRLIVLKADQQGRGPNAQLNCVRPKRLTRSLACGCQVPRRYAMII